MALADNCDFAERTREQMKALDDAIVVGVNDAGQVYAEAEDGTETIIGDPLEQRRPNREKFMVDTEAVHPEDGLPMETDAYGGDIATLLAQEPYLRLDWKGAVLGEGDSHVIVIGGHERPVLSIQGIAKVLHHYSVEQNLINIITGRLMYAARRGVEMAGKKNAVAELQTACVDILTEIDAEIEQRKTGGNVEDWHKLEQKSNRLSKAVRALV